MVKLKKLRTFAREKNCSDEDAAHAVGSYLQKKHAGNFGIAGSFSFSIPKLITIRGAIITNDTALAKKLRLYKNFGENLLAKIFIITWL